MPSLTITMDMPDDLLAYLKEAGPMQWGAVRDKTEAEHVSDFANSLRLTREHYNLGEKQDLQGLYMDGTEVVMAHTGTSPTAAMRACILCGLWNALNERAKDFEVFTTA